MNSIVFQIKNKHQVKDSAVNPSDAKLSSWLEAFLERPIEPGAEGCRIVEGTRLVAVRNDASDHFTVSTVCWNNTDNIVAMICNGDRLVLEAKVQHFGHENHIEWASVKVLLTPKLR